MTEQAEDAWIKLLLSGPAAASACTGLHTGLLQQRGPGPGLRALGAVTRRGRWPTSPTSTGGGRPARSTGWNSGDDGDRMRDIRLIEARAAPIAPDARYAGVRSALAARESAAGRSRAWPSA